MKEIYYSSYELKLKEFPMAPARAGALIRIDGGVGDIHPWPELGDLSIDEELEAIRNKMPTPLGEKTLRFAMIDAEARAKKINLLADLPKPENHLHLGRPGPNIDLERLRREVDANGFQRMKLKVADFLAPAEFELFQKLVRFCGEFENLKLRVDFNYSLGDRAYDFEDLLGTFNDDELEAIDFFEDPFLYEDSEWQKIAEKYNVRLALDRGDQELKIEEDLRVDRGTASFATAIVKPALEEVGPIVDAAARNMRRLVFTSYLDHPIGQLSAAYETGIHLKKHPLLIDTCGLLSQRAYVENEFSQALLVEGTRLLGAEGTGWGFDSLLEKLEWKKLR